MLLAERLVGKTFENVDKDGDTVSILFTDKSGITVNTAVRCFLVADESHQVTSVKSDARDIEIRIGEKSVITIVMDDDLLTGPESFVFRDTEGTYIIEN